MRCPSGLAALRRDHLLAQMMTKAKPLPPLELVQQLLDYDPATGLFRWKIQRGTRAAGAQAGSVNRSGYVVIQINNERSKAHRIAWLLLTKTDPGSLQIDHMNGNKTDNRACNLRLASVSQNLCNKKRQANNTSGYKGVCYHKITGKWAARIRLNKCLRHLGLFPTPELAHMAYAKAAAELHGDFARAA
jgi:hypothetical protein